MATLPALAPVENLIGSIRTFGEFGPMYQVTGAAASDSSGQPMVSLLVLETNETLTYSLEAVLKDPLKP